MLDLVALLKKMPELPASDLHLRVGTRPVYRVNGKLVRVNLPPVTQEDMERLVHQILTPERLQRFKKEYELDFAYQLETGERFRVNLFHQRETYAAAIRLINTYIPSFEELNLPDVIRKIADNRRGLVLVTGVTGSGKSTTLAAMIDYINSTRAENIITIEDPIEYLHTNKKSIIAQRELGIDTLSFAEALRRAMRQDPDVILLGEIRDAETMQIALMAADTGHLVLSTLHTLDALQTIYRILSFFPPHQHQEIRLVLSSTLRAIISQRLVPRSDKPGRVPAVEILIGTAAVRECIVNPEKTSGIRDLIAEGAVQYGMQTIDQSLFYFYQRGMISLETALANASNPDDFKLRVAGVVGGSDRGWKEFEIEKLKEKRAKEGKESDKSEDEEPPLAENRGFDL
ncbi:MAG TPA: type IV pilus twitching motility protein PilT [candidate division Zixibacteria bacterium]|nr:type IV pilus twitching motility protein PilT [candidate division Zixibacteria bacterium]